MDKESTNSLPTLADDIWNDTGLDIEALLNLIPFAGGFMATYFGEIRSNRMLERMKEYFKYFSHRIDLIDESKLDKEYLNSEEFSELFLQGAEQASRSTTKRRIYRFANILLNNALRDATARDRTQSVMGFVDRVSDIDVFVLLSFGHPRFQSHFAKDKDECIEQVESFAKYLHISPPIENDILESIIYMDNLGIMWVTQHEVKEGEEDSVFSTNFSAFRSPLGNVFAAVIAPPDFYLELAIDHDGLKWPDDFVCKDMLDGQDIFEREPKATDEKHRRHR